MPNKLGDDFHLYNDINNDWSNTDWSNQNDIGDITFDRAPTNVNIPKRGTKVKRSKTGQGDWRLSFPMNYDPTNEFVVALGAAAAARSSVHVAVADGPIATVGTNYWHAEWAIVGDPFSANLDEGAVVNIELAVSADSTNEPEKVTVA